MNVKANIPNLFTCLNLFSGCLGIVAVFNSYLEYASYFIALAAFFDFLDGFAARMLKVKSEIGVQLDSLADMVSFGLLPAVIIFHLISLTAVSYDLPEQASYLAFLISIFSALRLAKFNIDSRQSDSFIGLPTPANAILIGSFPLILQQLPSNHPILPYTLLNPLFLLALTALMSYLMIAEIPMFSLKVKDFSWQHNKIRFIFVGTAILLFAFFQFIAIPFIIAAYIGLSIINPIKKY
jgi:CDP-diacylglycerol--serine O-phosphatidyltransferase